MMCMCLIQEEASPTPEDQVYTSQRERYSSYALPDCYIRVYRDIELIPNSSNDVHECVVWQFFIAIDHQQSIWPSHKIRR